MKPFSNFFIIFLAFFFVTGCTTMGVGTRNQSHTQPGKHYHKQGPPPHAPAHGYRHKNHDGHELAYDEKLGAYIVVNLSQTYFGNNVYIRMSSDGRWLVSTTVEGRWRPAGPGEVPDKLASYYDRQKSHNSKKHKTRKHKYDD